MSTSKGKRRMPRREIPWIGKLLDRIPDSKLPAKQVVLQKLYFLLEHSSGPASGESARTTVRNELMSVWEYVGFDDVLKEPFNIPKNVIKPLHQKYRSLSSTPVSQQSGAASQKKRAEFLESLSKIFDI